MNVDVYWTYSCLNSLRIGDINIFFYALGFIENNERKNILMNVYENIDNEDIKEKLSKINHEIPVIVA